MKAIVQHGYGAPTEVLELVERDPPVPESGEVLVRVHASSVNHADWERVRGHPLIRAMEGPRTPRNPLVGLDLAGTVEAVGSDVEGIAVGDEVFGEGTGAFAELAVAPAEHLVKKPKDLPFEDAAVVPLSGLTALQAIRGIGKVKAGQAALINGASGGVGTFAVQIAKALGAEVTGVCSTHNVELVRSLGADRVIDYKREGALDSGRTYDFILDNVGNFTLFEWRRALTPEGTLVPSSVKGAIRRLIGGYLMSPFVGQTLRSFVATPNRADLSTLKELLEDGKIRPAVDRRYTLADAPDALHYFGQGHARAKIGISVADLD